MNKTLKLAVLLVCAALAVLLAGCDFFPAITGSGTLSRSVYPATGFSGIQASQAFQVRIVPDPVYSVNVTCDDNLLRYLIVEHSGSGTLRLSLSQGYNYRGVTLIAEVHMPVVTVIDASGASTVNFDSGSICTQPLRIVLSGASTCQLPHVSCGDLSIDISGASRLTCTGSAAAITLNASGASHADVINCTGTRADVHLSGASEAWVDVGTHPIDLSASGASTFYYGGTPALAVHDLSGASRVVKVR